VINNLKHGVVQKDLSKTLNKFNKQLIMTIHLKKQKKILGVLVKEVKKVDKPTATKNNNNKLFF